MLSSVFCSEQFQELFNIQSRLLQETRQGGTLDRTVRWHRYFEHFVTYSFL
jgi:hypothetical protein